MKERNIATSGMAKILCFTVLCFITQLQAAGLLTPTDGSTTSPEIRRHNVKVVIENGYALTTVDQIFHNPGRMDLEAIYSFPIPEKASVAEFSLWVDGKQVNGEVLVKQEARRIYHEEKAAGREAGLTEQDSYKHFEVSVYPVRAGQDTSIRLVYIQPASMDTGVGRYVYPLENGGVDEEKQAFWTAKSMVHEDFSFDMQIRSAFPVDAARVPDRPEAVINRINSGEWGIHLSNSTALTDHNDEGEMSPTLSSNGTPAFNLNKDIAVYWRHQKGLPGSVELITHKDPQRERGTFMMVVTPGDDLNPINQGRDWIFVLDISGSMKGKYATLAAGVQRALQKLQGNDRFRIVVFNNTARELTRGSELVNADNVRHYSQLVAKIEPSDGTNLFAGIAKGLASLDADRTSAIVLVTDGVANVGETAQRKFIDLIGKKDIRLFTVAMGNSANRPLLNTLSRRSNGFAINASNSDDVVGQILSATSKVTHQALHGVEVQIHGLKTTDITPNPIASLYRGQQLILFGHYWGGGSAEIILTGKISGRSKQYQTRFEFPASATRNPEIERLWAFATIEHLMEQINDFGETPDLRSSVTDLAIEYGLVTEFTSMLVVRDDIFEARQIKRNNRQRLANEGKAIAQRAASSVVNHRVDHAQSMFTTPRPSFGGGRLDALFVLFSCLLLGLTSRRRNQRRK